MKCASLKTDCEGVSMGEELSEYERKVLLLALKNTYDRLKRAERY